MPPTAATSKKLCTTESESIGREFIDNWSHYISLLETNTEKDVLELLALLETVRVKWQQSEAAANHYKDKLITSEDNNKKLVKENERLKFELLNCQSQLDHVQSIKHDVEKELDEYKNQWEKLRSIIKESDQSFIADGLLAIMNNVQRSNSVRRNVTQEIATTRTQYESEEVSTMESTQSDIDYDRTGDSLDSSFDHPRRASRKRRSRSQAPESTRTNVRFGHSSIKEEPELESAPSKRSRNADDDTEITATIRIPSGRRKPSANINIRRSMNRSMSESTLVEKKEKIALKPKAMTPHYSAGRSTYDLRSPHGFAGSWTRGQEIERRTHRVRTFIPVFETCDVCTKRFGITAQNALKCVDCNIRFHRHCQSRAPMPCVPKVPMPKTPSKQKCPLVQYCPETHPYIPPIMIHCIVALERDRLTKEGIYRLPGADQAVGKLYQEFISERKVPNLSNVETENITGCLKKFLRELRDSLIPSTSYDDFIRAVEENDEQQIIKTIFDLPAPNRDTLAYFILHLQNVAKNSSHNKMPIQNLARVLAPTIVGYSKLVTPCVENVNELNRNQYMILYHLLKIPSEFWKRFIENNMGAVLAAEARMPGSQTPLLTVTPTKTQTSSSTSRNGTPKMQKPKNNNNQFHLEFEDTNLNTENCSPIIQPLSMASKTMRGINFKPAL
uniref:Rac GTPase-activating protein 1 n=1 Tax=Panagrolaimus superbus TaxID=310955 RepID=A0A914YAS2_9BILA